MIDRFFKGLFTTRYYSINPNFSKKYAAYQRYLGVLSKFRIMDLPASTFFIDGGGFVNRVTGEDCSIEEKGIRRIYRWAIDTIPYV